LPGDTYHFYPHSAGQVLVTELYLTARDPGKLSLAIARTKRETVQ
jgi:hypothetical protein